MDDEDGIGGLMDKWMDGVSEWVDGLMDQWMDGARKRAGVGTVAPTQPPEE